MKPVNAILAHIHIKSRKVSHYPSVVVPCPRRANLSVSHPSPVRTFMVALLALLSAKDATATCVIAVRDESGIVIGADSREGLKSADGSSAADAQEGSRNVCKLRWCGQSVIAVAGLVRTIGNGPLSGLEIDDTIKRTCDGFQGSPHEAMARIEDATKSELQWFTEYGNWFSPGLFGQISGLFDIMVAGLQDGLPVVMITRYALGPRGVLQASRNECPGGDCPRAIQRWALSLGNCSAIAAYGDAHPELALLPADEILRRLIAAQAEATPGGVGGPIDIIRVGKGGMRWIQRKESCGDIPKQLQEQSAVQRLWQWLFGGRER